MDVMDDMDGMDMDGMDMDEMEPGHLKAQDPSGRQE